MQFTFHLSLCKRHAHTHARTHSVSVYHKRVKLNPLREQAGPWGGGGGWGVRGCQLNMHQVPSPCCLNIGTSPIHIHESIVAVCKSSSERGFQNKGRVGVGGLPKDVHKFLVCKWWVSTRRGRTVAPPFTNPAAAADPDELLQRQILQIAATEKNRTCTRIQWETRAPEWQPELIQNNILISLLLNCQETPAQTPAGRRRLRPWRGGGKNWRWTSHPELANSRTVTHDGPKVDEMFRFAALKKT